MRKIMIGVALVAAVALSGCKEEPKPKPSGGDLRTPPPVIYDEV